MQHGVGGSVHLFMLSSLLFILRAAVMISLCNVTHTQRNPYHRLAFQGHHNCLHGRVNMMLRCHTLEWFEAEPEGQVQHGNENTSHGHISYSKAHILPT